MKGQLKHFNINQLDRVMHILGQRRMELDTSSIPTDEIPEESQMAQSSNRMEYPSMPKQFNLFQEYKNVEHDGNMLKQTRGLESMKTGPRLLLRWVRHFIFFPGVIFFNPEMAEQYNLSCDKYINYFHRLCETLTYSYRRIN